MCSYWSKLCIIALSVFISPFIINHFLFSYLGSKHVNPTGANLIKGAFPSSVYANFPSMLRKLAVIYAAVSFVGAMLVSEPSSGVNNKRSASNVSGTTTDSNGVMQNSIVEAQVIQKRVVRVPRVPKGIHNFHVYFTYARIFTNWLTISMQLFLCTSRSSCSIHSFLFIYATELFIGSLRLNLKALHDLSDKLPADFTVPQYTIPEHLNLTLLLPFLVHSVVSQLQLVQQAVPGLVPKLPPPLLHFITHTLRLPLPPVVVRASSNTQDNVNTITSAPSTHTTTSKYSSKGLTVFQALNSSQFWLLWSLIITSATAGLNTASVYKSFASTSAHTILHSDEYLTLVGGLGALCNVCQILSCLFSRSRPHPNRSWNFQHTIWSYTY